MKEEILKALNVLNSYKYEFNNGGILTIKFVTLNTLTIENVKCIAVSYSISPNVAEGVPIGVIPSYTATTQYFFPWEVTVAIDYFIERMEDPSGDLIFGFSRTLTEINLSNKDTPKVICQDQVQVTDIDKFIIERSVRTHDGVAYMFDDDTSLQLIKCKIPDDQFKSTERFSVIYSDYKINNTKSEIYPLENFDEVVNVFINRLQSVDPSNSIVTSL